MKICIENTDKQITGFRIRHKALNVNFAWVCENLSEPFPSTEFPQPNVCEIYIDDTLELETFLSVLERANRTICDMIRNYSETKIEY